MLKASWGSFRRWQEACPLYLRVNMKRSHAATLEAPATGVFPWALLVAEIGAALVFFSSDLVPALLVRSLQIFLRF